MTLKSLLTFDAAKLCRYISGTSLLFVSTAERGAVSLEAALAFFTRLYQNGVTWAQLEYAQFPSPMTDANGTFHKPPNWA